MIPDWNRSISNKLSFHKAGEGSSILLLHGVGLRAESWFRQIDILAQNHSVYALDLPGHCKSEVLSIEQPDIKHYTDKIGEFFTTEVDDPPVIIGHSLGALIAIDLAARLPQTCKALIAITPVYQRTEEARLAVLTRARGLKKTTLEAMAVAPLDRWFENTITPEDEIARELCHDWLTNNDIAGYAAAYHAFASSYGADPGQVKSLIQPALFLAGEHDPNSTPKMSEDLASLANKGRARIIEGARHMLQLTHAVEANRAILDFLKEAIE